MIAGLPLRFIQVQLKAHPMANLAGLLEQHCANPQTLLYRQYTDNAWRDYSAHDVMALAARWQQAFRSRGL